MAGPAEEHEGASIQEQLIEACRRDNTDLLQELISSVPTPEQAADLLNNTTTVMGNHLYHEAASRGNYDVIDMLLDQEGFECDPVNRLEGDTPLHSAIRWINSEPPAQREFGSALVEMMLEAGSSPRIKNKGGLTPVQLVDPRNTALRELIQKHEYASLNAGDFVSADDVSVSKSGGGYSGNNNSSSSNYVVQQEEADDDADFSGSDEEERAEWERRRRAKRS